MTVDELFRYIDDIKPNAFDERAKLVWLNELEAMIQQEVFLIETPELYISISETLKLTEPHDSVYRYYMQAMVDFHNGEYDKYNATYEMFNAKWKNMEMWHSTHYPTVGSLVRGTTRLEVK